MPSGVSLSVYQYRPRDGNLLSRDPPRAMATSTTPLLGELMSKELSLQQLYFKSITHCRIKELKYITIHVQPQIGHSNMGTYPLQIP